MKLITLFAIVGASRALLVPPPEGPYNVAVKHFELVDLSRIDHFAPEPNITRRIMVSAYLPVEARRRCKAHIVPYMPSLTASVFGELGATLGLPQGTIESFNMEFCDISTIKPMETHRRGREFPVAIFSPGAQGSRFVYGGMARSLASLGYLVFTLDHTYETLVVEFPDGSAAYETTRSRNTSDLVMLEARTNDVSFLVSQLSNKTITDSVLANFPGTFDSSRIVVYGHSFGGSTAAVTAQRNPRVIGGLNLDGPIYASVNHEGFKDKPFIIVGVDRDDGPEWDEFYTKIDSSKMILKLLKAQHYAFTDVPLLLEKLKIDPDAQKTLDEVFGTLDGRRVERATNQIAVGLMDWLFKNDSNTLKTVDQNADIEVVQSDLVKHS
ncbi:platelet-activating factor acetylhydrolase [Fusarium longipes]|uniref:1-alkyl-2-acetylglycerophosphocholine esterase n=1 Tax=Fusarium longipes TaxID=694270 RepID=A0A395T3W9_9HYPO|nr:platelet-activating factor acetylhydrolase [Fusarium longipes]